MCMSMTRTSNTDIKEGCFVRASFWHKSCKKKITWNILLTTNNNNVVSNWKAYKCANHCRPLGDE